MHLGSELEACLREFAEAGPAELRENGSRIAPLSTLSWEVRGNSQKPLLHLWSANHNLTRRVLAITDHSEKRLALAVEAFGRTRPDKLEFLRLEFERSGRALEREAFVAQVRRLCESGFPDEIVESITSAADLEHTLSGNYARGVLRRGSQVWALCAVPRDEAEGDSARCLTYALLWLDRVRQTSVRKQVAGIRILLPEKTAASVAHLSLALHPSLRIEIYEHEPLLDQLRRVEPSDVANLSSWIVPARETQLLLDRARPALEALLPASRNAIALHGNIAAREVVARFRGLACLRWHEPGVLTFGLRDPKIPWQPAKAAEVKRMFSELELCRHPLASDTRNPVYRAQGERWLEFLVCEDVTRVDSVLDQRFAYSQILAGEAGEHGILDVLSVTRTGRLAILELKTAEHPVFLLQAVSYWLRVKRHLEQGDFPRYGYFPGTELQTTAPLIYLVAPALRFHPATSTLLRYLAPQVEILRVGLAESWRRGLCVVLRQ